MGSEMHGLKGGIDKRSDKITASGMIRSTSRVPSKQI